MIHGFRFVIPLLLIALMGPAVDCSTAADIPPGAAEVEQEARLTRKFAEIDWKDITLDEACERLHKLSGLNITIDWPTLSEATLEKSYKIDLRLHDVSPREILDATLFLTAVNSSKPLEWEVVGSTVLVTTADAMALQTSVRIYDVGDILASIRAHPAYYFENFLSFAPTPIMDLADLYGLREPPPLGTLRARPGNLILYVLAQNCFHDQWAFNGGVSAAAWVIGDHLIVCHNPAGHRLVAVMLDVLRESEP